MTRRVFVALLASVCILAGTITSGAQEKDEAAAQGRLEQIASSYAPNNAFMGTVLVVEGDRVLLDKGYGMASLEWQVPNTPEAKFRLGSLTKQFTATLILLLQQDGKLNVNDPVSKWLTPRRHGPTSRLRIFLAIPPASQASPGSRNSQRGA